MIEMVVIIFLLCGQPVYVSVHTAGRMRMYTAMDLGDDWPEFVKITRELGSDPTIDVSEFRVEDQTKGMVCGTST